MIQDLTQYDRVLVNTSGGKDSQTTLDVVCKLAKEQGVLDRVVAVHADLGRVEWEGTKELAREQAEHYGVRFLVCKRTQNDLLDHVRTRGMWPSNKQRYCTSDHKRGPIRTVMTQLADEHRAKFGRNAVCRILNVMGMRAEESPARAKKQAFEFDKSASNGRRQVYNWLPIHDWTVEQVWANIRQTGVRYHRAYDLGMPRLSCCFCIFAPEHALRIAGHHNPELLAEYVKVEREIGHTFRTDVSLVQIQQACQSQSLAKAA